MDTTHIAILIMVVTMVLYITEIIPLSITSLLACICMGIFGCCSLKTVFSGFSNNVTMMIIGMCIVGDTLFHTGAAVFLGTKLMRIFGHNEKKFLFACILISALLSAFLSNSATVAMMLPIAGSSIAASSGKLFKKYTFMPIGYAAIAGGGLTLIGSTPQIIAQGILSEYNLREASFFEYFLTGVPKVAILVLFFMTLGYRLLKVVCNFPENENESNSTSVVKALDRKMIISMLILFGCVLGFVFQIWNVAIVSMLGASACIVTRCITAKEAFKKLDWNAIILLACALSLAACINESGAGKVIATSIINVVGKNANPYTILIVVAILATCLGNLISSSAATPILAPICVLMAPGFGINARTLVIAVVVFSSIVYASPTSTPPNSMPLVAGYRYKDYLKIGGLLNIITVILLLLLFPFIYNLI